MTDNIAENDVTVKTEGNDAIIEEPAKVKKKPGRKKVGVRVRLVDHETRDKMKNQGVIYTLLPHELFSTPEAIQAETERLRKIQRERNELYNHAARNNLVVAPRETVFPDVVYNDEINLILDPGTGNTILLVASSKAGKTTVMMNIYEKYFVDYVSVLFAHNPQLAEYRAKNLIVSNEYLPKLIDVMRSVARENKNKFDWLCMFDDMLSLKADTNITDLFLSLRNSNISSIISLQYINLMSKACRGNVNNILAGAHNSDENILVLIKCYLMSWMRKMGVNHDSDMVLYYRKLTANHGFLLIHPSTGDVRFIRLKM